MKKIILSTLALILAHTVFGQQKHTINWGNGTPKIQLIIKGIDTLLREEYRENGTTLERKWHNDSIYLYDRRGIVLQKLFFNKGAKYKTTAINRDIKPDSLIVFSPNGTILSKKHTDANGLRHIFSYSNQGDFVSYETMDKVNDKLTKTTRYNRNNEFISRSWTYHDLDGIKKDTSFYKTGEISSIWHIEANGSISSITEFDKNGQIEATDKTFFRWLDCLEASLPDSIEGKRDKLGGTRMLTDIDFPDTFFVKKESRMNGLVDMAGNWVLKPQFDNIITYRDTLFKVQKAGKYGIISKNEKWLIPPQYDEVKFTDLPNIFIVEKVYYREYLHNNKMSNVVYENKNDAFPDFTGGYKASNSSPSPEPAANELSNFSDTSIKKTINLDIYRRYGLLKTDGTEILPVKYQQIMPLNSRSPVFLVETGVDTPQYMEDSYRYGHFGLFDIHKGFVVDTSYQQYLIDNSYSIRDYNVFKYKGNSYTILRNNLTQKAEIFNHFGQKMMNSSFEKMDVHNEDMATPVAVCGWSVSKYPNLNFYRDFCYIVVHDKGKSGLFDLDKQVWQIKPNQYDTIITWLFVHEDKKSLYFGDKDYNDADAELVLLAKRKGKWWILNAKGQPISNNYFDTIGEIPLECTESEKFRCIPKSIFGIRNGKMTVFSEASYPKKSTISEAVYFDKDEIFKTIRTFEGKKISINKDGVIHSK